MRLVKLMKSRQAGKQLTPNSLNLFTSHEGRAFAVTMSGKLHNPWVSHGTASRQLTTPRNFDGLAALCASHGIAKASHAEHLAGSFPKCLSELSETLSKRQKVRQGVCVAETLTMKTNCHDHNTNQKAYLLADEENFSRRTRASVSPYIIERSLKAAEEVASFLSEFEVEGVCDILQPPARPEKTTRFLQLEHAKHIRVEHIFKMLSEHLAASASGLENVDWALNDSSKSSVRAHEALVGGVATISSVKRAGRVENSD